MMFHSAARLVQQDIFVWLVSVCMDLVFKFLILYCLSSRGEKEVIILLWPLEY